MVENNNAFTPDTNSAPGAGAAPAPGQNPVAGSAPAADPIPSSAPAPVPAGAPAAPTLPRLGQKFRPAAPRADFTSSAANGDIVLNPNAKKSKTPLIIALALLFIVLAVAAIVLITKKDTPQNVDPEVGFNRFANYLVSGEVSDTFDLNVSYNKGAYYPLHGAIDEHNIAYFDEADQLINAFLQAFHTGDDESLDAKVSYYQANWPVLSAFARATLVDENSITEYYFSHGAQETSALLQQEHQRFVDINNENATTVAEGLFSYAENMLDQLKTLESNGCIKNGSINNTCASKLKYTSEQWNQKTQSVDKYNKAKRLIESITDIVIEDCWSVSAELQDAQ